MNRIRQLREKMSGRADAFYSACEQTRLYLTGFRSADGTVFVTPSGGTLYVDFRYAEDAEKMAEDVDVVLLRSHVREYIFDTIEKEKIKRIGYEEQRLTVAELEELKKTYAGVEFVPMGKTISEMCTLKDDSERDAIRAAQKITDTAFSELLDVLNPEMTETDVAAELEYRMRRHGATGFSFETIAVSGIHSSKPHGVPQKVRLNRGFLTMDFGASLNGYCSDMTRTVCIGKAEPEEKKLYNTVLKAQKTAIEEARIGMKCSFIDKIARDIIEEAGYKGCFGHALGHGVGLYIHEDPRFSPGAGSTVLKPGHVVTVEPGIYIPGKYGARIEDMIFATENGVEDITRSPKDELIEIY